MIQKLLKVQAELKAPKGQYNKFGGYKYRSQEDILEAVKPLLNENGLMLTISDSIERIEDRYYIKATCAVTDGEKTIEVSAYAREPLSKKGMDDSQITGAASSYARKYALNGLFLIDDTKDADAVHKHDNSDVTKDLAEALDKVQTISGLNELNTFGDYPREAWKANADKAKQVIAKLGVKFDKESEQYVPK